ncbi:rhodanese-like domain-containing protein [Actinoplanes sp. NPDC026619]|uniref:rhodanese-like domain-containing protein n=1 Tax=Actinoplanes sp. NPDC026619 TaxID=3155798 RepID=UPI0034020146
MSRYIVIGAGAVGASLAAELHRAGVETLLVARGAHLAALRDGGLRYVRPDGEHTLRLPVAAGPAEVELAEGDVLLLATKTQDTAAAIVAWAWQPVKRADGSAGTAAADLPIVTLQNGLENERIALRSFEHVIGGVVWIPALHLEPGVVVNRGTPEPAVLWLGRYPEGADRVAATIADDLRRGSLTVHVVPDVAAHKAAKLLGNLVNGLDALYPPSELRAAAVAALRDEARAVYAAAGITPATPDPGGFGAAEIPGRERGGNSTWQSLARQAPPEIDYLSGEIVLLGRLHGVATPHNEAIRRRIHRAVAEATPAGSLGDADLARTLPGLLVEKQRPPVLVSAPDLYRRVAEPEPPVLLDVRWALGDPHGHDHYREGHIPGALFVDLETDLAGPHAPGAGRHPLPSTEKLQAAARRWGITRERGVVVYDNTGGLAAARAWWLLRWAGVPDVRILDGGLAAWRAEGYGAGQGEARPQPASDIVLDGGHLPTLTADEAAALPSSGTLLDARAGERYRGEVEPVDPQAGHIPGAISAPTTGNLRDGVPLFKTADELRQRFAGLENVGVYCGSGVTAAHEIAALAVAGIDAALYPGSWSAWSADPDRPVATGETP